MSEDRNNGSAVTSAVSRRGFLRQASLLGLSLPLAGGVVAACSKSTSSGKGPESTGVLRVGYLAWVGNVTAWLPEAKQKFEDSHPGVTVELVKVAGDAGDFVQRATLEARKGEASHDVVLGYPTFGVVGALAKAKAVTDIGDLIPDDIRSRMPESVLREVTGPDGKVHAFPFYLDVVGFIYNKKLLGSVGGQPPSTWDELRALLPAIKGKLPADTFAYGADWSWITRLFLPILVTMTDQPYADNGTVDMSSPAALEALKVLKELVGFMPPSSGKEMGSAEVFQAGKVVMETYWQAQYFRAKEAGKVAEADIIAGGNLRGKYDSTVFWGSPAVFPAASRKTELALQFVIDTFLGEDTAKKSIDQAGRLLPLNGFEEAYPEWMRPMYRQLVNGKPLPLSTAFTTVMKTGFQQEVEKMVLTGQSPEQTQESLAKAFAAYQG